MLGLLFAAGLFVLAILLVALGFLLGRSVRTEGDARGAYLALGTFVSLLAFVIGLGVALDGLVRVALPGYFGAHSSPRVMMSEQEGIVQPEAEPLPPDSEEDPQEAEPDEEAQPDRRPPERVTPPTRERPPDVPRPERVAPMMTTYPDPDAVREAGLVQSLRGVIVMLTAGVFFVGIRRLAPAPTGGPDAPEEEGTHR